MDYLDKLLSADIDISAIPDLPAVVEEQTQAMDAAVEAAYAERDRVLAQWAPYADLLGELGWWL